MHQCALTCTPQDEVQPYVQSHLQEGTSDALRLWGRCRWDVRLLRWWDTEEMFNINPSTEMELRSPEHQYPSACWQDVSITDQNFPFLTRKKEECPNFTEDEFHHAAASRWLWGAWDPRDGRPGRLPDVCVAFWELLLHYWQAPFPAPVPRILGRGRTSCAWARPSTSAQPRGARPVAGNGAAVPRDVTAEPPDARARPPPAALPTAPGQVCPRTRPPPRPEGGVLPFSSAPPRAPRRARAGRNWGRRGSAPRGSRPRSRRPRPRRSA